jgi:hypothetical protein
MRWAFAFNNMLMNVFARSVQFGGTSEGKVYRTLFNERNNVPN